MKKNERILARLEEKFNLYNKNPNAATLQALLDIVAKSCFYLMQENLKNNLHKD